MELHSITFPGLPEPYSVAPATESAEYPGCYYRTVNGKTEWENPPMVLGVEYRTTERWQGKAVYTRMIDMETLPNSATKSKWFAECTSVIRCVGQTSDGNTIPYTAYNQKLGISASTWGVIIDTNFDASELTATAQVWYVKD